MILGDMLDIKKGDIITVVGAGGKTSFIEYFTKYYKDRFRILLTTTTKIYVPIKKYYEEIYFTNEEKVLNISNTNGVTVCGKYINEENKIIGLDFRELDVITPKFDIAFIEGDGSKRKKLKGWNELEPVVYKKTTHTVGVVDITSLGLHINEENIHRVDKFKVLVSKSKGKIDILDLKNMILNPNGLFKYSKGKKVLFINKVENTYYEKLVKQLINIINKENNEISVFYGSIKNKKFSSIMSSST